MSSRQATPSMGAHHELPQLHTFLGYPHTRQLPCVLAPSISRRIKLRVELRSFSEDSNALRRWSDIVVSNPRSRCRATRAC